MSKARELADVIGTQGTTENVLSGRRNFVINGDFKVSQRGDYTSPTNLGSNGYRFDRWTHYLDGTNGTIQQIDATINGVKTKAIRCEITTAGAGEFALYQIIEAGTVPAGATVTFSAWVRSNTSETGLRRNNGAGWSGVTTHHSGNGQWEFLTDTFVVYDTVTVPNLQIAMYNSNVGDYYEVTQVQLELGSVATPFEHRSYGEELALCQRYYRKDSVYAQGYQTAGEDYSETLWHPEMRTYPTTNYTTDFSTNVINVTVAGIPSVANKSANRMYLRATTTGYLEAGGTVTFDAEL